jgi:hypothetical protein
MRLMDRSADELAGRLTQISGVQGIVTIRAATLLFAAAGLFAAHRLSANCTPQKHELDHREDIVRQRRDLGGDAKASA